MIFWRHHFCTIFKNRAVVGERQRFLKVTSEENSKSLNSITFTDQFGRTNACAPNDKKQFGLAHTQFSKNSPQNRAFRNHALARRKWCTRFAPAHFHHTNNHFWLSKSPPEALTASKTTREKITNSCSRIGFFFLILDMATTQRSTLRWNKGGGKSLGTRIILYNNWKRHSGFTS